MELSVCFGPTNAISSKINRIPYLAFEDDFEYKIPFYHANLLATRHIMPQYIKFYKKNVYYFHGFKELAYLHPKYFRPNIRELELYNLKQYKYIFIREISNVSLNYKNKKDYLFKIIKYCKENDLDIVISLENDSLKSILKRDCIVLQEPVKDIYSLIKFANFSISSGDTMARESCLLGTPCIYTGGRDMIMNEELIKIGCLFKEDSLNNILKRIDYLLKDDIKKRTEQLIEEKIKSEWDDTTDIILKHINDFIN